jgi:hypothetical protein
VEFYRGRNQADVIVDSTEDPAMLIVDGPSKMVVFHLEHRLGGAIGMQDLDAGRTAAAALADTIGR